MKTFSYLPDYAEPWRVKTVWYGYVERIRCESNVRYLSHIARASLESNNTMKIIGNNENLWVIVFIYIEQLQTSELIDNMKAQRPIFYYLLIYFSDHCMCI